MNRPVTAMCALTVGVMLAAPSVAQSWPHTPSLPADIAAQQRLQRQIWRAEADHRAGQARADQLESRLTRLELEQRRFEREQLRLQAEPAPTPPPGFLVQELGLAEQARQRRIVSEQAFDALDAWLDRSVPPTTER